MLRLVDAIARRCRRQWYRWLGVQICGPVWLQAIEIPRNCFDIHLSTGVALDRGVVLLATGTRKQSPRITIGNNTYINRHSMVDASERVEIGADVMIGPFCYITDHDHGFGGGQSVQAQPLVSDPVTIKRNVWIGAHTTVLKGVTIGENAVVGAGAVVTRDVPAGSVVVGVPAKVKSQA